MIYFVFILSCLATYRISYMLSRESGPFDVFAKLREAPALHPVLRKLLGCILCESVWWAGLISLYLISLGLLATSFAPIYWLATSGVSVIICQQWPNDS